MEKAIQAAGDARIKGDYDIWKLSLRAFDDPYIKELLKSSASELKSLDDYTSVEAQEKLSGAVAKLHSATVTLGKSMRSNPRLDAFLTQLVDIHAKLAHHVKEKIAVLTQEIKRRQEQATLARSKAAASGMEARLQAMAHRGHGRRRKTRAKRTRKAKRRA
jgi:hypothetical protein